MGYYRDPRTWKIVGYAWSLRGTSREGMARMVVRGRDLAGDVHLDVDAVVIGTGAGGSVALRELARAGLKVVALEEGGYHTSADFTQREDEMLPAALPGRRRAHDATISPSASCRGGAWAAARSTTRTSASARPTRSSTSGATGTTCPDAGPTEHARVLRDASRSDLSVTEIPAALRNPNNEALRARRRDARVEERPAQAQPRRLPDERLLRARLRVRREAERAEGARPPGRGRRRHGLRRRRVPARPHERGASPACSPSRARTAASPRAWLNVRARVVVLAASAVGSAELAIKSNLPDPYRSSAAAAHPPRRGRRRALRPRDELRLRHPAVVRVHRAPLVRGGERQARLDRAGVRAPDRHRVDAPRLRRGAHDARCATYGKLAVLTAMVHDETAGASRSTRTGAPSIDYVMTEADRAAAREGARRVRAPALRGAAPSRSSFPPSRRSRVKSREPSSTASPPTFVRPHGVPVTAVHPMGTMRMGDDPRRASCRPPASTTSSSGLFVADGSLFPTSLGGPPQISIYAFALHLGAARRSSAREGVGGPQKAKAPVFPPRPPCISLVTESRISRRRPRRSSCRCRCRRRPAVAARIGRRRRRSSFATLVGFATSLASKPRPIEMPVAVLARGVRAVGHDVRGLANLLGDAVELRCRRARWRCDRRPT